ncbi:MAG TPA: VOC family protein [Streptosporangiaceae bacterium]|nr:VOC family protein [Streptosporangiaceae bacterium]
MAVLDHVAVGTGTLAPGWELFAGLLGGAWAYGGHSPGFWWGQLQYSSGPKVELLTPTGGTDAAFLERFLAGRGPGFHHLNFLVPAIEVTLGRIRALGIEPVGVRLENPHWKEAFVRPTDGHGTVIQVAEQAGPAATANPPAGLGEPGPPCSLSMIEHRVADVDGATRLFEEALGGKVVDRSDTAAGLVAELCWSNGARLRLVQPDGHPAQGAQPAEGVAHLEFSRDVGSFGRADRDKVALLSRRLGVSIRLAI